MSTSTPIDAFVAWLTGDRSKLPPVTSDAWLDDGQVVFAGAALPYVLRKLPEGHVRNVFATSDQAAVEVHYVTGMGESKRQVWLLKLQGDLLAGLTVVTGPLEATFRTRERYTTPPVDHPDYLAELGFRPTDQKGEGLPDGERFTDGHLVVSLRPTIGTFGWALVDGKVHVLGSFAPLGAQVWGLQRGVPWGLTRDDRRCDLEVLEVRDSVRSSQMLSAIADAPVNPRPGLVLEGVDLSWHVHDLWRGTVNGWFTWQLRPGRPIRGAGEAAKQGTR